MPSRNKKKPARKKIRILKRSEPLPQMITQPGYATGDMFGISGTLIDTNAHIVISTDQTESDPTDKGSSIRQFYIDSGIGEERIHLIRVGTFRPAAGGLKAGALEVYNREFNVTGRQLNKNILPVDAGTEYIAEHFSEEMRRNIRNSWDINDSQDAHIKIWLEEKGVPVKGKNALVLWSRFSGKKGDVHIEHDSSYFGMAQIAFLAARYYDAVIIAGDKGYKKEKGRKYSAIAEKINAYFGTNKVFNLTEFWTEDSDSLKAWGGNKRFGQFKLYDFLNRNFFEVKHLGFRSGNLEAMALLGYTVRYMEEPDSEGGFRMSQWHLHAFGKTIAGGMATGYERLGIFEPPTRSGKYYKQLPKATRDRRPDWSPGIHKIPKPKEILTYKKGFSPIDLKAIMEYAVPESAKKTMILSPKLSPLQIPVAQFAYNQSIIIVGIPVKFKRRVRRYNSSSEGTSVDPLILLEQARKIISGDFSYSSGFNSKILAITQ
ncbi:hypothetical protein ODZ84_07265 [Chryseobacterium fluminis]|uniref:hypothetical protein n=1 Tax=Chryseobacterium fluminis TaxID=2983606 RepID=UPI00225308C5|nr:hypothetical protein [Chryseobacterium sp. MMS21-Ot14]UZT99363.1 hypothetical protein ODZ84_07265 [Chryseobacterium sp. MMS21-Ot14]